jgi:ABC-2 type transport system permease protein
VVFVFLLAFGIAPTWSWFGLIAIVVVLTVITVAVSMILASLFPRFRDIGIIWGVLSTALFYATPVLYPLEVVSQKLRDIISLNPLSPVFELARRWVIDPAAPGPVEQAGGTLRLLIPIGIVLAICVFAVWIFNREAPRIAEEL